MTNRSAPRFVLAGGGTGGHLYPGLAVAEAMLRMRPETEISVFGTSRPIDEAVVRPRGYELIRQVVQPMPRKVWRWPGFLLAWRRAVAAARADFVRRRPVAVLGLGGYAAAPPVVAAAQMGIATALFNPDAEPGRANRRLARHVGQIFVQWSATAKHFPGGADKLHVTGCPVRPVVVRATREEGLRKFQLDPARRTLLITGASQGARSINLAAIALTPVLASANDWQVVHLTGDADLAVVQAAYKKGRIDARVMAFSEDLPLALASADLVVSRAGASTLAELTARGVASILLPYPYDRLQHQMANARVLEESGAAVIVEDSRDPQRNAESLKGVLGDLMVSSDRRGRLAAAAKSLGRDDAAERIATLLLEAAGRTQRMAYRIE